jgi:hypothetical protein
MRVLICRAFVDYSKVHGIPQRRAAEIVASAVLNLALNTTVRGPVQ